MGVGRFGNTGWWFAFEGLIGVASGLINSISQTIMVVGLVRKNASAPTFYLLCLVQPLVAFFDHDTHGTIGGRGESMWLSNFFMFSSLGEVSSSL